MYNLIFTCTYGEKRQVEKLTRAYQTAEKIKKTRNSLCPSFLSSVFPGVDRPKTLHTL